MNVVTAYGDANASIHGLFAVLAALWHRERTGEGQHIELAESYAITNLLGEPIMDYFMNNRTMKPQGNRHPHMCPHNAYRCKGKDKWVTIAVKTDDEWKRFCKAIDKTDLISDKKYADIDSRHEHEDELDKLITGWTVNYTPYEVMDILQKAGVAAMPVMNIEDQYTDPHYQERGTYIEVEHPVVGAETLYATPLRLSKTPGDIRRHAPSLGEDNEHVFGEILGISREEISQLVEEKVIY